MRAIGRIGGLWRYPVKSLAGEALDSALLDDTGIVGDRRWALRSELAGELVNCKVIPALLSIGAAFAEEPAPGTGVAHAVITLPDGRRLSTSDPLAGAAISAIAGRPLTLWPLQPEGNTDHYRLRRPFTPEVTLQRMGLKPTDPYPDFSTYEPELIEELQYFFSPRGSYKDAYPLHFVTSAALETARKFRPGVRAEARRFRPNFLIDTIGETGLPELEWTGFDLVIGDVVLHCGQKTVRCLMPAQAQRGLEAEPAMGPLLRNLANLNFGAYCFVRRPGTIRHGDEVFLDTRKDIHPITYQCLPLPADIRAAEQGGTREAAPAVFAPARVVDRKQETGDVVSIGLKLADALPVRFLPGQHLILSLKPEGHERPILRSYSISSAPASSASEDYRITVKRIGLASSHLHDRIRVGDEIAVRHPSGRFFALPTADTPLALISNGIGVTPLFGMLQSVAAANPDRPIFWLHATDNADTHLFRHEVQSLAAQLESFEQLIIYRRPSDTDVAGRDYHATTRIVPDHFRSIARMKAPEIFVCGSGDFLRDAVRFIGDLDVVDARIHTERFHVERKAQDAGKSFSVRFARSGIDALWSGGDLTLLEIAEDLGIETDYGCRFGSCEACSVPLIEGDVSYPDEDIRDRPGEALLCCARPLSDITLDL
jgi:ferredoxin-NADP reductase